MIGGGRVLETSMSLWHVLCSDSDGHSTYKFFLLLAHRIDSSLCKGMSTLHFTDHPSPTESVSLSGPHSQCPEFDPPAG